MSAKDMDAQLAAAEPDAPRGLGELIERLHAEGRLIGTREGGRAIGRGGVGAVQVRGVAYDSRRAAPGAVFVAVPGLHADGHDLVGAAERAGAAAAVVERPIDGVALPQLVVNRSQPALATVAAWWYGD